MNIYTGSDDNQISEYQDVVPQKNCSISNTSYENVCIKKDVVSRKNSPISKTLYENVSFKRDRKVEITESNNKLKLISSQPMKRKNLIFFLLFVLFVAALATSFGLIAMNINDVDQQKQEHEVDLYTLIKDINQLKQNITYQTEIIHNQSKIINSQSDDIFNLHNFTTFLHLQLNQSIKNQNEFNNNQTEIIQTNTAAISNQTDVINNNSDAVKNLETGFNENLEILTETTNTINENLLNGYVSLDNDWIAPLNGYQYIFVSTGKSWDDARSYCQSEYGADLASVGVQSIKIRQILRRWMSHSGPVWIGLNDLSTEGTWKWISLSENGYEDYATNDISLWYRYPPTNSSSCNCASFYSSSTYAHTRSCSSTFRFLCEKQRN